MVLHKILDRISIMSEGSGLSALVPSSLSLSSHPAWTQIFCRLSRLFSSPLPLLNLLLPVPRRTNRGELLGLWQDRGSR